MNDSVKKAIIGVDTGGTFTDLIYRDEQGLLTHKLLSTPEDPGRAVLHGIQALIQKVASQRDTAPELPPRIVHGSTVATNALLENTQSAPVLLTTSGFTDLMRLGRQHRSELHALEPSHRPSLIPASHALPVPERMDETGRVIQSLTDSAIDQLLQQLAKMEIHSLAICLLHSYANPEHEARLAKAIRSALPEIHLSVSSEMLPEFREFERASTCLINAAVAPKMNMYLGKLEEELGADRLRILASNGGAQPLTHIKREPVQTILSGPAGGVLGAYKAAASAGIEKFITLDMGGTSTDVALCNGEIAYSYHSEAAGIPVRLPCIDIHTVGAGGGSIAWKDSGGALRVGPRSAGATPGPVCYGQQTSPYQLTVTDANVFLHHLPQHTKLAGSLSLDLEALGKAFEEYSLHFPNESSVSIAEGILRIAEATMARAVQKISVSSGHDPREFTLIPFGGAGALHACDLASSLGMTRVLIPHHPGLLSAKGMTEAGSIYEASRAVLLEIPANPDSDQLKEIYTALQPHFQALSKELQGHIQADGVSGEHDSKLSIDLRYQGQSHELNISLGDRDRLLDDFAARHEELYGYTPPDSPIELVNARYRIEFKGELFENDKSLIEASASITKEKSISASGPITVHQRDALQAGDSLQGPFSLIETHATTWVPDDWLLQVLPDRQLLITHEEDDS